MQRLKKCDRFYYETDDPNVRFSPVNFITKESIQCSFSARMPCNHNPPMQSPSQGFPTCRYCKVYLKYWLSFQDPVCVIQCSQFIKESNSKKNNDAFP
uniref:Ovule protein n=1 Tax=Heterorhabditis bacteriophora TaxID=37862 RepID=A0A1I7WNP0_HETBA